MSWQIGPWTVGTHTYGPVTYGSKSESRGWQTVALVVAAFFGGVLVGRSTSKSPLADFEVVSLPPDESTSGSFADAGTALPSGDTTDATFDKCEENPDGPIVVGNQVVVQELTPVSAGSSASTPPSVPEDFVLVPASDKTPPLGDSPRSAVSTDSD